MESKPLSPNPEEPIIDSSTQNSYKETEQNQTLKSALTDVKNKDEVKIEQRPRKISQSQNLDEKYVSISGTPEQQVPLEETKDEIV